MRTVSLMRKVCLVVALLPSLVLAVEPSVSSLVPYGVRRGGETEVVFRGARLGDAEQLLFYEPGIETKKVEKVDDNACKATLLIGPDCPLGVKGVRVRTATGISNLMLLSVGALPVVDEKEPNNQFSAPQPIEMNCTVHGLVQNEDVDYFVVEARKGERLTAEIEGVRLGMTFFDPYLAILNTERFELSRSDDAALCRQDGVCGIVVPQDGRYIIEVRETSYGGNGASNYRLHVGNFPRPTAVMPAGGRPGETVEFTYLGDPAGPFSEQVTLPSQVAAPEFELFARDAKGIAPSPNLVRVVDLPNFIEAEPNDAAAQATAAGGPGALNGVIQQPGDVDLYKLTAKKGQQYDVRVHARASLRSALDSVLSILNAQGGTVTANDDSGGPDSYVRFGVPADGDYFVMVTDHLASGGLDYGYRVEIAPVRAELTMTLPEKQQYIPTTIACSRGNRVAAMVSCSRANFGGDVIVDIPGMPAGLTIQAPVMAANLTSVPVLFSAPADAPIGGALVELQGKTADPKLGVQGGFAQRTMLVRGQNNRDVYGHDARRMAIGVTAEVPFTIELVQPKVPIVRTGSMGLKVVAKRSGDFKAPISVTMLYNPPGIGSSGSISIPEGQTEAIIPLTANGGAGIGKWPIVVRGRAAHGGGTVEVATQMAELEVADSYLNLAFQKTAGELGKETSLVVKVERKGDFPEVADIQLLGLPANTSTASEPMKAGKETSELIFPIKIAENATPNTYKSLVCQATIVREGEPITMTVGSGELRVDRPPPPKPNAPATPAVAAAAPAAPADKPARPLSRLEQLRLQKQQQNGK